MMDDFSESIDDGIPLTLFFSSGEERRDNGQCKHTLKGCQHIRDYTNGVMVRLPSFVLFWQLLLTFPSEKKTSVPCCRTWL